MCYPDLVLTSEQENDIFYASSFGYGYGSRRIGTF